MFFDEEKEYEVTYRVGKEIKEGTISVSLEEYEDSFSTNLHHLSQSYGDNIVNEYVTDDKIKFIEDKVKETFGKNVKISKRELKGVMEAIDEDYKFYQEEGEF